jgi:hypothetical protein
MRKVLHGLALVGAGLVGAGVATAVRPGGTVVLVPAVAPAHAVAVVRHATSDRRRAHAAADGRKARQPMPPRPRASRSLYERTTSPTVLRQQGCHAGHVQTNGVVVLDFGKLAHHHHSYGTITFSGRFASNRAVTWALKSYARGYTSCLPRRSKASITLARGTSNYNPTVPSLRRAGRLWAAETLVLALYLRRHGMSDRVTSAAADDVEPAWDRGFRRTHRFFAGFASARTGYLLYNFGSLDGGAGGIWNVRQAYYVSGGMRYARVLPEIYNHAMARQWAYLSRRSVHFYGKPVRFAGLMTQHASGCSCGLTPAEAHSALVRELSKHPRTRIASLPAVTNIGSPS